MHIFQVANIIFSFSDDVFENNVSFFVHKICKFYTIMLKLNEPFRKIEHVLFIYV